jgi:hypothetical protein
MINNQDPAEINKIIQEKIVELITKRLSSGQMTQERAKEIAGMILDKMPNNISSDDLYSVLPKLDDHFDELSQIIVPVMLDYERRLREEINLKIDEHLRQKNFDEVLRLAREAIEKEKQLS